MAERRDLLFYALILALLVLAGVWINAADAAPSVFASVPSTLQ